VLLANMPHDPGGRGVSFRTAILSTLMYEGRVGGGESSRGKGVVENVV